MDMSMATRHRLQLSRRTVACVIRSHRKAAMSRHSFVVAAALLAVSTTLSARQDVTQYVRYDHQGHVQYGILEGETIRELEGDLFASPRPTGETVRLSAVDPLNLVGIVTPGPRIPAVRTRDVVYCDGLPLYPANVDSEAPSIAGA